MDFAKSSWCLVIVVLLFLAVLWVCLQFVIVAYPDHTHLLFFKLFISKISKTKLRIEANLKFDNSIFGVITQFQLKFSLSFDMC